MNESFRLLLSLSLSASLVTVLIFAAVKLFKKRLDYAWHYYIWLIVIIRLLVPYAPEINLMDLIILENRQPITTGAVIQTPQTENTPVILHQTETPMVNMDTPSNNTPERTIDVKEYLWIVWAAVAMVMFVWKVFGYMRFIRFSAIWRKRVENPDVLDIYQSAVRSLKLRRAPILYKSRIAGLPMLIGLFRSYILIPDSPIDEQSLRHIMLHELTHYKRRDGFYKWLVQIVVCIHWFNPLVYFMAKEIDKSCELSCDEAVVRGLSRSERRGYGNMLLNSLQYSIQAPERIMTLPLSKDGRLMKTRLNAIVNFRRISMGGIIFSLLLGMCIATGAAFAGAYPDKSVVEANSVIREATGATYLQSKTIVDWISAVNIECVSITDSNNPLIEGMDTYNKAFDLIGKDGNTYLLILQKEDNDFTAVLDSNGKLLHGIIDSSILPAYFTDNEKSTNYNNSQELSTSPQESVDDTKQIPRMPLEKLLVQMEDMWPWLESLDKDIYSDFYYAPNGVYSERDHIVIQVTDVATFRQSPAMQEAEENVWIFYLEEVRYSANEIDALITKMLDWDRRQELQIESFGASHDKSTMSVGSTSLSAQNRAIIEEFVGIGPLEFYNPEIANEATGTGEYRMLGLDGITDWYIPRLFDKPFALRN